MRLVWMLNTDLFVDSPNAMHDDILPARHFRPNDQYSREPCTQIARSSICLCIAPCICCFGGIDHCDAWVEGTYCASCWSK